jgi:hypothetical protein
VGWVFARASGSLSISRTILYCISFLCSILYSRLLFPLTPSASSSTPSSALSSTLPLDALTWVSQLDRCSPYLLRAERAENTRRERSIFPVAAYRRTAPRHVFDGGRRRARTTSATGRACAPPRLPRRLRLRSTGARAQLLGPWRWSAGRVLIPTTSAWKKVVRKGRREHEWDKGKGKHCMIHPLSPSLTSLLQLDHYSLRRARPPC